MFSHSILKRSLGMGLAAPMLRSPLGRPAPTRRKWVAGAPQGKWASRATHRGRMGRLARPYGRVGCEGDPGRDLTLALSQTLPELHWEAGRG